MSDKDDLKDDLEAFKRAADSESEQRREALDMLIAEIAAYGEAEAKRIEEECEAIRHDRDVGK